jgi:hypothetical protein
MLKVVVTSALFAVSATMVSAQQILPYPGFPASFTVPTPGPYLPGLGQLAEDEAIIETIVSACVGQPGCIAIAWASTEVDKCRHGIGVPGGCFGPNGEVMKGVRSTINQLPPNLHPDVILRNIRSDLTRGPGHNNEGCKVVRNLLHLSCGHN